MTNEVIALDYALVGMNNLFIRTFRVSWPNPAVGGGVFQTVDAILVAR